VREGVRSDIVVWRWEIWGMRLECQWARRQLRQYEGCAKTDVVRHHEAEIIVENTWDGSLTLRFFELWRNKLAES
jgi:hypothetical protein